MDFENSLIRLKQLIRKLSYREGDFTLASGAKSKFYVDLKMTTLHPEGAKLVGLVGAELLLRSKVEVEGVGGLTLGADPIATTLSIAAFDRGHLWPAFIVRKETKDHGTQRYIEGVENLKPGASVVIVEDVTTSGGSSFKAIERVRAAGFQVSAVLTVVDREQGAGALFDREKIRFISMAKLSEIQGLN